MITLHYLNDSRAHRILWMLEEIGAPYEVRVWHRDPKTMLAPVAFEEIHPLGKFPVIQDGPLTLAESGAIVDFLATRYATQLIPEDASAKEQYRYWLHYAEGSLMPPLLMAFVFSKVKEKAPRWVRPIAMAGPNAISKAYLQPTLTTHMRFVDGHLAENPWFAGDAFSAADIQMSFPLEASVERIAGEYPNIMAFVRRIQQRPAYQRALQAAGVPYAYALGADREDTAR
jgi:glutathione S-transferase